MHACVLHNPGRLRALPNRWQLLCRWRLQLKESDQEFLTDNVLQAFLPNEFRWQQEPAESCCNQGPMGAPQTKGMGALHKSVQSALSHHNLMQSHVLKDLHAVLSRCRGIPSAPAANSCFCHHRLIAHPGTLCPPFFMHSISASTTTVMQATHV